MRVWTVVDGFCIADNDGAIDDGPDFVVPSVEEALRGLIFLLDAEKPAEPPT